MSLLRTLPAVAAACGLALSAVSAACAQDAPPPPAAPGALVRHDGMMRERMQHWRAEHQRLLHDALGIRPDQEGAWQAFVASMAPGAHEHRWDAEAKEGEHRPLTTPERLDRIQARLAGRTAAFQRRAAAVKAFYAALTPAQQHTFDALARLHAMHGGMGMRRGPA